MSQFTFENQTLRDVANNAPLVKGYSRIQENIRPGVNLYWDHVKGESFEVATQGVYYPKFASPYELAAFTKALPEAGEGHLPIVAASKSRVRVYTNTLDRNAATFSCSIAGAQTEPMKFLCGQSQYKSHADFSRLILRRLLRGCIDADVVLLLQSLKLFKETESKEGAANASLSKAARAKTKDDQDPPEVVEVVFKPFSFSQKEATVKCLFDIDFDRETVALVALPGEIDSIVEGLISEIEGVFEPLTVYRVEDQD